MKKHAFAGAALLALALGWLVSCGGSPGEKITVRITDPADGRAYPVSVAYQVEDGDWAWLRPGADASYSFYLPGGGKRYGVAVRCPDSGGMDVYLGLTVYLLSADETKEPRFVCKSKMGGADQIRVTVNADVSGVGGARSGWLYYAGRDRWLSGTSRSIRISPPDAPELDLLLAASSSTTSSDDPANLLAARLFAGQAVSDGSSLDLSLTSADAVGSTSVSAFAVPAGWSGSYRVGLAGADGVRLRPGLLGEGGESGGGFKTAHGLTSEYFYMVSSSASSGGPPTHYRLREVRFVSPGVATVSPTLLDPLPAGSEPDASGAALRYNLTYDGSDLAGYFLAATERGYAVYVWASAAWLDGATGYTLPDFSTVAGMEDFAIDPAAHPDWRECAVVTSGDLVEMLNEGYLDVERGLPLTAEGALEWDITCASDWD